ncbi:large conductance mechanosensitive channel protein MscL [Microbacterium sp. G2-8]|uniref:large conductance mechanosensitive channel protein MscL n=1 Tax=Microbacterium sp. G2-8 TaxID=2842454 RepID=UPI001C898338|nr:large conductance mechanosensitive channel protein MscL [Microbacterium sp. G2-8]
MFQGFKEFIMRGNVVELAVAVVIGTAFTAIVTAIVESIVNPLIALFFSADSLAEALQVEVPAFFGDGVSTFAFGAVIAALVNFLAVAVVVYVALVLPMNKLAERRAAGAPEEEVPLTQEELLTEIRDLLAQQKA